MPEDSYTIPDLSGDGKGAIGQVSRASKYGLDSLNADGTYGPSAFGYKAKAPEIQPRLLSVKQLSVYLSLPLSTVYMMVEKKEIPFKRFCKKIIRFDKKEIDKWVDLHYDKSYHFS